MEVWFMFDRELTLYAFVLNYCRMLTADLDEAKLLAPPAPGVHSPAWILGHLAISTDYAASLLGLRRECPAAWFKAFGPGSVADAVPSPAPTKAELLSAIEAGQTRVAEAAKTADPAVMAKPHALNMTVLRQLPTNGDLLAHLLTTHPASHLGQLSLCRRLMGLPALF
jgi:hypothetical protein